MPPKLSAKGPSQRQLRVGEQIRHVVVESLLRGHFHNKILMEHAPAVTVSEVSMSPDLKHAKAYVTILNDMVTLETLLEALNDCAPIFQKDFNSKLNLKFTPRIRFVHDVTFDKAQRMDALLSNLKYSDQDNST